MTNKKQCYICRQMATWYYVPASDSLGNYFCDNCVNRGCSCETDDDGNYLLDQQGRPLPCCEYDYDTNGFEDDND